MVGILSALHPICLQILVLCHERPAAQGSTLLAVIFASQRRLIWDMVWRRRLAPLFPPSTDLSCCRFTCLFWLCRL
jgi:hypothetical protein